MFEYKKNSDEKKSSISWSILKWYWMLVPMFFLLFIMPNQFQGGDSPLLHPRDIFNIIFQILNLSLAGIITMIHVSERSKTGAADNILKIAIVQQFLVQNYLGLILTTFAWYRLPYKVKSQMFSSEEAGKGHFQPKTLYILTGIVVGVTILSLVGQIIYYG